MDKFMPSHSRLFSGHSYRFEVSFIFNHGAWQMIKTSCIGISIANSQLPINFQYSIWTVVTVATDRNCKVLWYLRKLFCNLQVSLVKRSHGTLWNHSGVNSNHLDLFQVLFYVSGSFFNSYWNWMAFFSIMTLQIII